MMGSEIDDPFPPVKVVLHPAPEPRPALKYRLFPGILDRKPGNAAVVYGKVTAEQRWFFSYEELWEKIDNYAMQAPLADLRKEKGRWREMVTQRGGPFYFLDRAARSQFCDWQLPIGEPGQDLYSILLPECQQMRQFARLLAVRARLQIADGQYDEAVHTLQTGYALSKHVGGESFLVQGLVGLACSSIMSAQVQEFIQQPDAPNLYWALTNMPRPLVDLRPAVETEMEGVYLAYPDLRDVEHKDRSPQEWQQLMDTTIDRVYRLSDFPREARMSPEPFRLAVVGLTLRNYPEAKRFLIARGHGPAEVEAMPVAKVVLLYTMGLYEELRDDLFKWFNAPYPEAQLGLRAADKPLKEASSRKAEIIPLASTLLPSITAVSTARAKHERGFVMLRVLEALRLYGAAHNRLPDKLSDITEVPIPVDPVTGNPFVYRRSGETAWLEATPPADSSPLLFGTWRYDIRFVPKGTQS